MTIFVPEPGSLDAIDQGCSCPPQDGPGAAVAPGGLAAYLCDARCPLHGLAAAAAFAADETWTLGEPANDNE